MSEEMLLICPSCVEEIVVRWEMKDDIEWRGWKGVAVVRVEHRGYSAEGPFPSWLWEESVRTATMNRLVDAALEETKCVVVERVVQP